MFFKKMHEAKIIFGGKLWSKKYILGGQMPSCSVGTDSVYTKIQRLKLQSEYKAFITLITD